MDPLLRSILVGATSAAIIDLTAFVVARQKDPLAKFDVWLALARVMLGALTGFAGGNIPTA